MFGWTMKHKLEKWNCETEQLLCDNVSAVSIGQLQSNNVRTEKVNVSFEVHRNVSEVTCR